MSSAFGMPSEALEMEGIEVLADDEEQVEAPEGEETSQEAPQPEPEPAAAAEPEGEETVEPEGETEEPQGYEFAGRYFTSQDEAERAYREMQGLQSRTVEQQRAMEAQIAAERQQMAAFIQQAEPLLRQAMQQEQTPEPAVRVPGPGDPDFDPEDPAHVQRYLNAQIEQQVATRTANMQQQLQQSFDQRLQQVIGPVQQQFASQQQVAAQQRIEQDMAEYSGEIDAFRAQNPEVAVGSAQEAAVAGVLQPLRTIGVMPSRPMLQLGYDATRSPNLHREVEAERMRVEGIALANPQLPISRVQSLFDDAEGIATLYQRAGLAPQGTQAPRTKSERPHVETGGNGAPVDTAPGRTPDDLDRAFAKHMEDQKTASPFFGGGFRGL